MKHFFLKTALLLTLLFCAVLYGMDLAKQGMLKMEGIEQSSQTSSPLNFNLPGTKAKSGTPHAKAETNKKVDPHHPDELSARLAKLDDVHSFNPYSAIGDKLSDGFSSLFTRGIHATASMLTHILE